MNSIINEIHSLPKVILHDHLDGGLRPTTIIELAQSQSIKLPYNDSANLAKWFYQESTALDFTRCIDAFNVTCSVMQTTEALSKIAFEMLEDFSKNNVVYVETRFCPYLHTKLGLSYDQILSSVISGLEKAKSIYGIEYGVIICGLWNFSDEINYQMAKACIKYHQNGVVGYDFAGNDSASKLNSHTKTLSILKQNKIPLTVHAGEVAGIEVIIDAIDCGASRIGHACHLYQKQNSTEIINDTLQRIIENNIHIEINLSSNISVGVIDDIKNHPIFKLYKRGVSVALNTDDRLMFDTNINKEYELLAENFELNIHDFKQMNINALNSSFAKDKIKKDLLKKILGK